MSLIIEYQNIKESEGGILKLSSYIHLSKEVNKDVYKFVVKGHISDSDKIKQVGNEIKECGGDTLSIREFIE